jgi:soluble lytic murein transglycosylase-like protein
MRWKRSEKASLSAAELALRVVIGALALGLLAAPVSEASRLGPEPALRERIREAATRAYLDPKLVEALIRVESNFKPSARSPKDAMGLMQVIPTTADACEIHDPFNTVNNLMGACDCLRKLINRYRGNLKLALAAYNAGPGAVEKYGGIPPYRETQHYVRRILQIYRALRASK